MTRTLPWLAVALLAAACSSSRPGTTGATQQGTPQEGHGTRPGDGSDPDQFPGQNGDDQEGSDDAGVDCVFNDGGSAIARKSGWRSVAPAPKTGSTLDEPSRMFWTGHELLFYGANVVASYAPMSDTWKPLPEAPIGARAGAIVELAGTKLAVWGGGSVDGAAFDLCTKTWRRIPQAPIVDRNFSGHAWASTTNELIVWGGDRRATGPDDPGPVGGVADGAAFDLSTWKWRILSNPAATLPGFWASAWTGTSMVIYGGGPNHGSAPSVGEVWSYEPVADAWTHGAPPSIQPRQFSFTQGVTVHPGAATFFGGEAVRWPLDIPGDGATLDFATNTWSTIPLPPAAVLPHPMRDDQALFWIDGRLYVWGGFSDGPVALASGAVYDATSHNWSAMPSGGPPVTAGVADFATTMDGEGFVWADSMMIYRP